MEVNESPTRGWASILARPILLLALLAGFLAIGAVVIVCFGDDRRELVASTSPDGSWTVAVVGQKLLMGLGGIEVYVEVRDRHGRALPGSFVINQTADWASAKAAAGTVSCGDSQAVVDGRTILKPEFLRQ